jgi:hypothetical protein
VVGDAALESGSILPCPKDLKAKAPTTMSSQKPAAVIHTAGRAPRRRPRSVSRRATIDHSSAWHGRCVALLHRWHRAPPHAQQRMDTAECAVHTHGVDALTCSGLAVKSPRWLWATQAIDALPHG